MTGAPSGQLLRVGAAGSGPHPSEPRRELARYQERRPVAQCVRTTPPVGHAAISRPLLFRSGSHCTPIGRVNRTPESDTPFYTRARYRMAPPRVRGNLEPVIEGHPTGGSIPARAGTPSGTGVDVVGMLGVGAAVAVGASGFVVFNGGADVTGTASGVDVSTVSGAGVRSEHAASVAMMSRARSKTNLSTWGVLFLWGSNINSTWVPSDIYHSYFRTPGVDSWQRFLTRGSILRNLLTC